MKPVIQPAMGSVRGGLDNVFSERERSPRARPEAFFVSALVAVLLSPLLSGAVFATAVRHRASDPVAMMSLPSGIAAGSYRTTRSRGAPLLPGAGIDVVLVLDCSGSTVRDTADGPATDPLPDSLRVETVRLSVALASVDANGAIDRIGMVCFGSTASAEHRIPLTEIDNDATRRTFVANAERKVVDLGGTNYVGALAATRELLEEGDAAYRTAPYRPTSRSLLLVFASDGRPQMDQVGIDREQLRRLASPGGPYETFRARGWAIQAIGFGPAAVPGEHARVLEEMAASTGGRYWPAGSRSDLLPLYTAMLSSTARGVPISVPPQPVRIPVTHFFELPEGLLQATVTVIAAADDTRLTVFRADGRVVSPSDPDAAFTSTSRFRSATVREPSPSGLWKAVVEGQGTAVIEVIARPRPAAAQVVATPQPITTAAPTEPAVSLEPATTSSEPEGTPVLPLAMLLAAPICAAGYLAVVRRAASRSGVRVEGSADSIDRWTDVPWRWNNPLRPQVLLSDLIECLRLAPVPISSAVVFGIQGASLAVREDDGLVLNGERCAAGTRRLVPGDRIELPGATEAIEVAAATADLPDDELDDDTEVIT